MTSNGRVTARIVRTDDGEIYKEYRVGGVAYGSLAELESALKNPIENEGVESAPSTRWRPRSNLTDDTTNK
ncbi:hypothetical protein [Natrinema sp. J7-2]|uniref:hypothetical protein n=1 Tax=Natrinema sp. (strain J7-2) TaxID=406552 RepID=UPI00026D4D5D|nr:hypothetical protein [Natrinema sp. J7-2]AFO56538.1 hypothetical protein NJ7G_1291 [Natrinema sp. J7-2]